MNTKAKLNDLAMALESDGIDGEHISRFDREAAEMVFLDSEVLRSVEEDPDYDGDDLPDWQREQVETARALLADDGTRFIDPPHRDTHDQFEVRREFGEQWPDESVASDLLKQLGKLKRKLQGRISRGSMGSDVFIVEGDHYIGRACQYREPWPRADCISRKLRCADGREFLCETSANFSLDQHVIDNPPVILWPEVRQNAHVPADVQKVLAAIVR